MQRFHGTAARQLVLTEGSGSWGLGVQGPESRVQGPAPRVTGPARIRLMLKDLYAELTRRRRRAQIAARHIIDAPQE